MMSVQCQLIEMATHDVFCLSAEASIGEAARSMAQRRFSSIVVVDKDRHPVGIITERNILRAMQAGLPPETLLRTGMSSPVVVMHGTTQCLEAYQTCMREGIRHLVLVDGQGVVSGVVSETDFRLHLNLTVLAGRRQVISVAQRAVVSLPPHGSLKQALNLMQAQRETCVVVVEDEKPVGIVTERDVVRFYSSDPGRVSVAIADVMTSPVLTITSEATINQAAELMLEKKLRHLAVVDVAGRMLGLVSEHDLTQTMASGLQEEKIEMDEIFLRTFINTIPDLVWLKDANGVYLTCNGRFESLFGVREAEIIGKTDYEFVSKEQADSFRECDLKAMNANKPRVSEEWLTFAADGHRGLFETIKTPMRDGQGRMIGVLGVAREITERVNAEAELRASEEKLRGLYELSPMGIALTDMQGRYVEFNKAFQNICGYTRDELNQLDYWALAPKEYASQEALQLESLFGKGYYGPYEKEYIRKEGNRIPLRLNGVLINGSDGQPYIWSIVEDITERKRADEALRESEAKYRSLYETAGDGIFLQDASGFIDCNEKGASMYGLSRQEVIGRPPAALAPERQPDGRLSAEVAGIKIAAALEGRAQQFEWQALRADGNTLDVEITLNRIELGGEVCLQAVVRDISARKRAEETLRITASVFDNSQEAIIVTDAHNRIINVNPAFVRITGYSREEVMGQNPKLLNSGRQDRTFYAEMWTIIKEKKAWRGEIWNRRKCGEIYAELLSVSAICDEAGRVQSYVGVFSDITYFKDHEAELSHVANYDSLTGIPNRRLLADRLRQAIAHAQRSGKILAICYIDLDGFKEVNDRYGHEAGDRLLVDITRRLQEVLRAGDTLARLGGDEFVVLFNDLSQELECFQVLERVMQTIAALIRIDGHKIAVSASIGVTFYPADDEDGDTLLRHADQAMYIAKQSGKNRYHLYDPVHDQRMRLLHDSRRRIQQGLEQGEFDLYYQPKLELASGKIAGVEALIRWHHPEQGLLYPIEFLPMIENSDMEILLGSWVMDMALAQLHAWAREGVEMEVGINISARHLQSPDFVFELRKKLEQYPPLALGRLQIEVLETTALEDMAQSVELIEACRELGVSFALDDFGTGYSSLMYLSKLAADTLKIDQSFVQGMASNEGDRAIVQGVIALAGTFGRRTVAEGIEDPKLLRMLAEMGCGYGQGYSIAQPMPAGEFLDWYRKH